MLGVLGVLGVIGVLDVIGVLGVLGVLGSNGPWLCWVMVQLSVTLPPLLAMRLYVRVVGVAVILPYAPPVPTSRQPSHSFPCLEGHGCTPNVPGTPGTPPLPSVMCTVPVKV